MACDPAAGCLGGISGWSGKVCIHWSDGLWLTDTDGSSGIEVMNSAAKRLAYCRKFYGSSVNAVDTSSITAGSFYSMGNWVTSDASHIVGFCNAGNKVCGQVGTRRAAYRCLDTTLAPLPPTIPPQPTLPPQSPPPPTTPPPSPRPPPPVLPPPSAPYVCTNACSGMLWRSMNDQCDDGGIGSEFALCAFGTDCADCGDRYPWQQYPLPPMPPPLYSPPPPSPSPPPPSPPPPSPPSPSPPPPPPPCPSPPPPAPHGDRSSSGGSSISGALRIITQNWYLVFVVCFVFAILLLRRRRRCLRSNQLLGVAANRTGGVQLGAGRRVAGSPQNPDQPNGPHGPPLSGYPVVEAQQAPSGAFVQYGDAPPIMGVPIVVDAMPTSEVPVVYAYPLVGGGSEQPNAPIVPHTHGYGPPVSV